MNPIDELEAEKLRAEISNLSASTQKTFEEIDKIRRERALYPLVVGTGLVLALGTLARVFA